MAFTVLFYLAFIIIFIILRLKKQQKAGGRKVMRPPAPAAGDPPRIFPAGTREVLREKDPVLEFLREISGEKPPVRAAAPDEEEDELIKAAWQAFRPGEGREAAQVSPRPEARGASQPAAVQPAAAQPGPLPSPAPAEPETAPEEAAGGKAAAEPVIPENFSSRLARLGPLQRAIVMAEVLGKPKALRGDF